MTLSTMTRRLSVLLLSFVLAAGLAGCDLFGGDDNGSPSSLDGTWAATFTAQDTEYTIEMDLDQEESEDGLIGSPVTGSGTLEGGGDTFSFDVTGTLSQDRTVSLNLTFEDGRPGLLQSGVVSQDFSTISNATLLSGPPGFSGVDVTLQRQ
jgi:hypothetical protein